jgi:hypothetical protein
MEVILVNKHHTCQVGVSHYLRAVFPKYLLWMHDVAHNHVWKPARFEYCMRAITSVCVATCKRAMCNSWLHLRTDFRGLDTNDTRISCAYSAIVLSPWNSYASHILKVYLAVTFKLFPWKITLSLKVWIALNKPRNDVRLLLGFQHFHFRWMK